MTGRDCEKCEHMAIQALEQEPRTKNDSKFCPDRKAKTTHMETILHCVEDECVAYKDGKCLKYNSEQESTTKNDLVTLTFSKGTLKYSCKDYVVYKKEWLRSHYGAEIDIMFGDSQYKEPTTKNDLGVDCISRADALALYCDKCPVYNCTSKCASYRAVEKMPSVTPQEPKTGYLSIDDVMSVFDDFMCGEVDEDGTETFWEMLKDKAVTPQEPILDKIRAEIKGMTPTYHNPDWSITDLVPISEVLNLVDKYKAENEPQESESKE